jgi:hypothetical protein
MRYLRRKVEDFGTSPEKRKNRSLAIGLLVAGALILSVAVAGIAMHGYLHNRQSSGAEIAPVPQTTNSEPPAPIAPALTAPAEQEALAPTATQTIDTEAAASVTTQSESLPTQAQATAASINCHDNDILARRGGETSATRSQFANDASVALSKFSNIDASVGGDSNEYLLYSAPPDGEVDLRQLYADIKAGQSLRANLCMKGFSEVQFIVRDANMNQKLVAKLQTNLLEAFHYLQQRYGATPVK